MEKGINVVLCGWEYRLRKYFPIIKECLKFKKLIAMNPEASDNTNSVLVR